GASQNVLELGMAKRLGIPWEKKEIIFGTAGGNTKLIGIAKIKTIIGPEKKIVKELNYYIFNEPKMTPIILGRPFIKSLKPHYIDNEKLQFIRKTENGQVGEVMITMHNSPDRRTIYTIKELILQLTREEILEEKEEVMITNIM